jgi:hypothetical protein
MTADNILARRSDPTPTVVAEQTYDVPDPELVAECSSALPDDGDLNTLAAEWRETLRMRRESRRTRKGGR